MSLLLMAMIIGAMVSTFSIAEADELESRVEQSDPTGPVEGYRGKPYKAPTPWTAPGATTLYFAEEVKALMTKTNTIFVNVSPITLSPKDREGKRQWIVRKDKPMNHIPGSIWLPNVGYQDLEDEMDRYFRGHLDHFTKSDKTRGLLFYCTADCWMSWNAVKRAVVEYGYSHVYWYPYGIDGWKEVSFALESAEPEPFNP